jgi:hypothetical protein
MGSRSEWGQKQEYGPAVYQATADLPVTSTDGNLAITIAPLSLWVYKVPGEWTQMASPTGSSVSVASEITPGIVELASQAEVEAGTDDVRAITPLKLSQRVNPRIFDDFVSGGTSVGGVGDLNWLYLEGTTQLVAPAAGRVGVISRSTTATSGLYAVLYLRQDPTVGVVHSSNNFDSTFMVRLAQTDADTLVRFGLGNDATANPPANGVYLEKLAADVSWYGVTRSGGAQSRTAALGTTTTNWLKGRVRRIDASTVGFTLDGGVETTATANIPSVGAQPFVAIRNSVAVAKVIEIDYVDLTVQGLTR